MYGNVVNYTCQTISNGGSQSWTVADKSIHTNDDDISVYTTNTTNGILSVLTIRAVPISGIDQIIISCWLTTPPVFLDIISAILTIIGTISLENHYYTCRYISCRGFAHTFQ